MSLWVLIQLSGLVLGAVAALAFLAYTVSVWRMHRKYGHLPGPTPSSYFLGNLGELRERFKRGSSFCGTLFDWCVQNGNTYVFYTLNEAAVFTADPDAVKSLLVTENFPKPTVAYKHVRLLFNKRFLGTGLVTETNHEDWAVQRAVMNPAFSRNLLKPLMCDFNQLSDEFLDKLAETADGKTVITLLKYLNKTTLDVIGKVAYAMNINSLHNDSSPLGQAVSKLLEGLRESVRDPLMVMNPFAARQFKHEVREACDMLRHFGRQQIRARREAIEHGEYVPEDILTYIIKCQETTPDPKESEEIAIDHFLTFFVAGQETTANTVAFALMELGRHPEILAKLRQEVDEILGERSEVDFNDLNRLTYCDVIIKETLRLYPPAAATFRQVTRDGFKIGAYDIPKGTNVVVSTFVSSRLEKFNTDALDFKPERFLDPDTKPSAYTTYPFVLGSRNCIGQNFAKMEAKVLLAKFTQRFDMQIDPTQSFDFEETPTLRPKDGTRVTLSLRK